MSRRMSDRVNVSSNSRCAGNLSVKSPTTNDLYPSIRGYDVTLLMQDLSPFDSSQPASSCRELQIYPSISSAGDVDHNDRRPKHPELATFPSESTCCRVGVAPSSTQQTPSVLKSTPLTPADTDRSQGPPPDEVRRPVDNKYPYLSFPSEWCGAMEEIEPLDTDAHSNLSSDKDTVPRTNPNTPEPAEPASIMMIPVYFGDDRDQGLSVIYPSHPRTRNAAKDTLKPSDLPPLSSSTEPPKEYTFIYPQLSSNPTHHYNHHQNSGPLNPPHLQNSPNPNELRGNAPSNNPINLFHHGTVGQPLTNPPYQITGDNTYHYPPPNARTPSIPEPLEPLTTCADTFIEHHDKDPIWLSRVSAAQSFVSEANRFPHLDYSLWNLRYIFSDSFEHKPCSLLSSAGYNAKPRSTDIDCDWLMISLDASPHPGYTYTPRSKTLHPGNLINFSSEKTFHSNYPFPKARIQKILYRDEVNIPELQSSCRQYGVPKRIRAFVWQLLLGYVPTKASERCSHLKSKRSEYLQLIEHFFNLNPIKRSTRLMFGLVAVDTPRTHPDHFLNLFCTKAVQNTLERILYIWSCTNHNISYYQGLNDLVSIFLVVFLDCCLGDLSDECNSPHSLADLETALLCVEPDTYYCLTILLKNIGTFHALSKGGVYSESMLAHMESLVKKLDPTLYRHIANNELEFVHFAFRWMLCLFTRELTTKNLICLWDSCIIEGIRGFSEFYIYICVEYLLELRPHLLGKDMISMMGFIQRAPATYFTKQDVYHLVQKAYKLFSQYPLNLKARGPV